MQSKDFAMMTHPARTVLLAAYCVSRNLGLQKTQEGVVKEKPKATGQVGERRGDG